MACGTHVGDIAKVPHLAFATILMELSSITCTPCQNDEGEDTGNDMWVRNLLYLLMYQDQKVVKSRGGWLTDPGDQCRADDHASAFAKQSNSFDCGVLAVAYAAVDWTHVK